MFARAAAAGLMSVGVDVIDAGILTTAGDVLFTGGREGYFHVLDARTGAVLWKTYLGGAIMSAPVTYSIDGTSVTKQLRRQTWRVNDPSGSYRGYRVTKPLNCSGAPNVTTTVQADVNGESRPWVGA